MNSVQIIELDQHWTNCTICGKDMIWTVIDVVDGGEEIGGIPIEDFMCEDEAAHRKAREQEREGR